MGKREDNGGVARDILPQLQNRGVIGVTLGDYHFGALTSEGELLTWGKYQAGSLGLGDPSKIEAGKPGGYATKATRLWGSARPRWLGTPPDVTVPTAVTFGKGRGKFCFSAEAAGWHFGALVLDLEGGADDEDEGKLEPAPPGSFPIAPNEGRPGYTLPIIPRAGAMPFRVGFAGRGRMGGAGIMGGRGAGMQGQIPDELN